MKKIFLSDEEELAADEAAERAAGQAEVTGKESPEEAPAKSQELEIVVALPVQIQSRTELDEVLKSHHSWMQSLLAPGKKLGGGRANLRDVDMSGWDLSGVNLSGATLKHAKLSGANLADANLTAADLTGADLQGADLTRTKLRRALLTRADLRGAIMTDSDLRGAHLEFVKRDHPENTVGETLESLAEEDAALSENSHEENNAS